MNNDINFKLISEKVFQKLTQNLENDNSKIYEAKIAIYKSTIQIVEEMLKEYHQELSKTK